MTHPSTAEQIRTDGPLQTAGPSGVPVRYRVQGTYRTPERSGCETFEAHLHVKDALADLARQQADPGNGHIAMWDVLVFTAATLITVLEPDDYDIALYQERSHR